MSRTLMVGTLAVLLVLMGVLSYVMAPKPPAQPDAEQQKQMRESQQEAMKKEQENRKQMMVKMQQAMKTPPPGKTDKEKPGSAGKTPAPTRPRQMEIEWDWYKHRPQGEAGIEAVQKQVEQEKAAQPANAAPLPTTAEMKPVPASASKP